MKCHKKKKINKSYFSFFQEKHEASLKHPQSLSPQVSENEDVSINRKFI